MPTVGAHSAGDQKLIRYAPTPQGRESLLDALFAAVTAALAMGTCEVARPGGIAIGLNRRRQELGLSHNDLAGASGVSLGTIEMLSLAGTGLTQWAQRAHVRDALTIPTEEINEDLVLLPSLPTTLRIAQALGVPLAALVPSR
jgi:hypothetical protein